MLGEDLCFTMKVILTDRHGGNFRNELAHGMLSPNPFFGETSFYTWWMIFWNVCGPVANSVLKSSSGETASPNQGQSAS